LRARISRKTWKQIKHFSKVNQLMGAVGLDADANEQVDILHHFERTSLIDVIGQSGYPVGAPGFQIIPTSGILYKIIKGRYYVDGLLVENEADVEADKQRDLPSFKDGKNLAIPSTGTGTYLAYLDVWEHHITALDDPEILESALGGADTATRNKIVWQVKLLPIEDTRRGGTIVAKAKMTRIGAPQEEEEELTKDGFFFKREEPIEGQSDPMGGPQKIFFVGETELVVAIPDTSDKLTWDFGLLRVIDPEAFTGEIEVVFNIEGRSNPVKIVISTTGDTFDIPIVLKHDTPESRDWKVIIQDTEVALWKRQDEDQDIKISATYRYGDSDLSCDSGSVAAEWAKFTKSLEGLLTARTKPEEEAKDACILPPGAGYRRLQNQLYRIEIHKGGKLGSDATFKYSRDNASIESRATDINDKRIMISGLRNDSPLGFNNMQWIEVTDDRHQLLGLPGTLVKVNVVSDTELEIIDGTVSGDPLSNDSYPQELKIGEQVVQNNPRVIRWDMPANSDGQIKVEIPSANDGFLPIEDGVEVKFGSADSEYRSGNYWWIPARTIKADIEWPRNGSGTPVERSADGIVHHYSRLALLQVNENKITSVIDCRKPFPPLTNLPTAPPPTEEKLQNVVTRVHGNIVVPRDDDTISSQFLSSMRAPTGTRFTYTEGQHLDYVFHFPLSTTTANFKSLAKLTKVYLLFTTKLIDSEISAEITQVDVFDGVKLIKSFRDLSLKGDYSEKFIESENRWEINPPAEINFGLNISAYVRFPQVRTEVIFHGAGAHIEQQAM
jgi:hypothetical protein